MKHAVITGGSSGIGKALAQLLLMDDYKVSLLARDEEKLQHTANELVSATGKEGQVAVFAADVSCQSTIDNTLKTIVHAQGGINLLVLSAGIIRPSSFLKAPLHDFEETMQINYFGCVYPLKAALPSLLKASHAHVVFISSGAGLAGVYGYASYGPSKFALRGLAEVLATELPLEGITVSIVYPPDTDTPQLTQELKERPPETNLISGLHKPLSADAVAKAIMIGIRKRRFEITPGFEMTLLRRFGSLLLPLFRWLCLYRIRRYRRSSRPS